MNKNKTELDRIFEQGISDVSRAPQTPVSDERIAVAAKDSQVGAALWLRMHAKGIVLCFVAFVVGIVGSLLFAHYTDNQDVAKNPAEPFAVAETDTTTVADNTGVPSETAEETQCIASLPIEQSVTSSTKSKNESGNASVETRHGTSLQRPSHSQTNTPNVTRHTSNVSQPAPVIVKKTIVQRDTVVINETVIVKDTVYLMDN